jgi:hypothetical protein
MVENTSFKNKRKGVRMAQSKAYRKVPHGKVQAL